MTIQDGLWTLTILQGKAFIPTVARTEKGFYVGIEPVEAMPAGERINMEDALMQAVLHGNPIAPDPSQEDRLQDCLLKHAGVPSIAGLAKMARTWKLSKNNGAYTISLYRPAKPGDPGGDGEPETIPGDQPLVNVVHRFLERALANPAARRR